MTSGTATAAAREDASARFQLGTSEDRDDDASSCDDDASERPARRSSARGIRRCERAARERCAVTAEGRASDATEDMVDCIAVRGRCGRTARLLATSPYPDRGLDVNGAEKVPNFWVGEGERRWFGARRDGHARSRRFENVAFAKTFTDASRRRANCASTRSDPRKTHAPNRRYFLPRNTCGGSAEPPRYSTRSPSAASTRRPHPPPPAHSSRRTSRACTPCVRERTRFPSPICCHQIIG